MRVAVTTDNLDNVDAAFGLAGHIAIYDVTRNRVRHVQTHRATLRADLKAMRPWFHRMLRTCPERPETT
jgi:predicted Fe-Mo cluster-binding NifX family protein